MRIPCIILASFLSMKLCLLKKRYVVHSFSSFCVDLCFRLFWLKKQEWNNWVVFQLKFQFCKYVPIFFPKQHHFTYSTAVYGSLFFYLCYFNSCFLAFLVILILFSLIANDKYFLMWSLAIYLYSLVKYLFKILPTMKMHLMVILKKRKKLYQKKQRQPSNTESGNSLKSKHADFAFLVKLFC